MRFENTNSLKCAKRMCAFYSMIGVGIVNKFKVTGSRFWAADQNFVLLDADAFKSLVSSIYISAL